MTTKRPPNTMKITMIDGAMATAASTEGANEPTAIPIDEAAIDSTVKIFRKFKNFPSPGFNPQRVYIIVPDRHGKITLNGISAASFEKR